MRERDLTCKLAAPGVGVLLFQENNGKCAIKSMNPGGAAARDGRVRIGDHVLKIDGWSCHGMSLADVSRRIQVG